MYRFLNQAQRLPSAAGVTGSEIIPPLPEKGMKAKDQSKSNEPPTEEPAS
jgi:hypothetical protein